MKALRSISALLLAALVLVSSTSFMIGFHVCMGEVQNIALFTKADGCEKEQSLPPCHRHQSAPCCDDEALVHQGNDFKASDAHTLIVATVPIDLGPAAVAIAEIIPSSPAARWSGYHYYDPPLRSCDLTVQHRTLLI